jgi:hypothetical protein
MLELHVTTFLGDLRPAISLKGADHVTAVHVRIYTHIALSTSPSV